MLDDDNIKQSSKIIRELISEGKIIKPKIGAYDFFMSQSQKALLISKKLVDLHDEDKFDTNLWVVNTAYYSMFFAATSLLAKFDHKINTKIGIHKLTYHALVYYFISQDSKIKKQIVEDYGETIDTAEELLQLGENKLKNLVLDLDFELNKRKTFTYETGVSVALNKAVTSYRRAEKFFEEIKNVTSK